MMVVVLVANKRMRVVEIAVVSKEVGWGCSGWWW